MHAEIWPTIAVIGLLAAGRAVAAPAAGLFDELEPIYPDTDPTTGSRLDSDEYDKEDAQDFALWKSAKEGEPGWDSPWGYGRPGWSVECSAMAMKHLGVTLDIHTGGVDNLFPHHENEIAQSEGATGEEFSRFWLHAEHLLVDGQKMSKSMGNYYTLRDLLERDIEPAAIRHQYLSAHYRSQHNFTLEGLEQSTQAIRRLWDFVDRVDELQPEATDPTELSEQTERILGDFEASMDDDLNAPGAMGKVFELMRAANIAMDAGSVSQADVEAVKSFLAKADTIVGIIAHEKDLLDADVDALIQERIQARTGKNYARADEIRDELAAAGIMLEDSAQGTRWRRAH